MAEQKTIAHVETNDIKSLIQSESGKKQFALALPKHINPDRFVRVALTAFTKTPKLLQCTKESLLAALLDCSSMGIEPDGRKAHLIPYGNKCQLIVDYKGLVDIARRSGEIADIHADVVCENDAFECSFGSDSKLNHTPAPKDRGPVVQVYSFVRLKDKSSSFEVMNIEEVNKIKTRSKAASSGPWVTDWNEMAKKTVFRRHSKWLPESPEMQLALEKDWDKPGDLLNPGTITEPMIGLKNDKDKKQPAIEAQAAPAEAEIKKVDKEPWKPSPSDLTKTSEVVMKREIMVMIIETVGEDRQTVETTLAAYTTYKNEAQVLIVGIRDITDALFKGEWVKTTHEKIAKVYLEKTGKK